MLGKICERGRNFSLWISFGGKGLALLVERDETCCTTKDGEPFRKAWVEGGRRYFLELRSNKAGRFLLCSIFLVEEKGFSLVFFEGRGFLGGGRFFPISIFPISMYASALFVFAICVFFNKKKIVSFGILEFLMKNMVRNH